MAARFAERDFRRWINYELRWHLLNGWVVTDDQPGIITLERATPRGATERVLLTVDDRGSTVVTRLPDQPKRPWWRVWDR
jgi:hypothetical protein